MIYEWRGLTNFIDEKLQNSNLVDGTTSTEQKKKNENRKIGFFFRFISYEYIANMFTSEGWILKSEWHQYRAYRAWRVCRWWRTLQGSVQSSRAVKNSKN